MHNFSHEAVPQNVSGNTWSGSSIQLLWTLPLQSNNITDYINYYVIENEDIESGQIITNRSTEQLPVIDSLHLYNIYLCRAAIFTSYLNPYSDYISIETLQAGMYNPWHYNIMTLFKAPSSSPQNVLIQNVFV